MEGSKDTSILIKSVHDSEESLLIFEISSTLNQITSLYIPLE